MKQSEFEAKYGDDWDRLQRLLNNERENTDPVGGFPALYRQTCANLAMAKHRRYSPHVLARLNSLVSDGHQLLYGGNQYSKQPWLRYVILDFPRTVRANFSYVLLAALLFLLPGLLMASACFVNEDIVYSFFDAGQVREFESMYDPGNDRIGRERDSEDDWYMFGFYVYNNISVAFRTFSGGLIFGVGSVFFLIYNGLAIGGVAGHLTKVGYTETFYPFVVGHGAFELTAIVLCGAAGLKLGMALLAPGQNRRLVALKIASRECARIVYGAAAMLVFAAALEAFWSSSATLPVQLKYVVGGLLWLLVLGYLALSGRGAAGGS